KLPTLWSLGRSWKLFKNKSSEVFHCRRSVELVIADHIDTPFGGGIFYFYFLQAQMVQQFHIRHNRDAEVLSRQTGNYPVFFCLVRNPGLFSHFLKEAVYIIPHA